ncbi:30S ribosomal protein S13 [Patescibacteria group bacterium]|nr:30S ribosomal protein S13 [Patescibacteria group bacterium]
MARLSGVNLPNEKRIEIGLMSIYGIGRSQSKALLKEAGLDENTKVKDMPESDIKKIRDALEKVTVEGDLRRERTQNLKRLTDIGAYRGIRHTKKLPAHGQRTKTNARTKRGKRVTVGSGKLKTAAKT